MKTAVLEFHRKRTASAIHVRDMETRAAREIPVEFAILHETIHKMLFGGIRLEIYSARRRRTFGERKPAASDEKILRTDDA